MEAGKARATAGGCDRRLGASVLLVGRCRISGNGSRRRRPGSSYTTRRSCSGRRAQCHYSRCSLCESIPPSLCPSFICCWHVCAAAAAAPCRQAAVAAAAAACCAAALAQAAMIAGLIPPSFPAAENVSARVTSVMLLRRRSCAAGYSGGCSVTYCILYIVCSTIAHQSRSGRGFCQWQ